MKKILSLTFLVMALYNVVLCQISPRDLPLLPGSFRVPYVEYVAGDSVVHLDNDSIYFPVSSKKVSEQIIGKVVYVQIEDSLHRTTDRLVRSQTDYFHSCKGTCGYYYRKYTIVGYRMLFDKEHGTRYINWPTGPVKTSRHNEIKMVDEYGDTITAHSLLYTKEGLDSYAEKHLQAAREMGHYNIKLVKAEKPAGRNVGKSALTENGVYEDVIISIKWNEDRQIFNFQLKNMSNSMMKVIWDEALIVNFEGFTERVLHKGADLDALKQSQQPSLIPSKAQLADYFWSERYYGGNRLVYGYGGDKYNEENDGKRMKLILPVQVGNITYSYTFIFEMKWEWTLPELREQ